MPSPRSAVPDKRFQAAWERKRHDATGTLEEAEVLRDEATVHGDVIARAGGEEFVAVLPGCTRDGARLVAEQVCAAIREHGWGTIRRGRTVTTSAGIAALDPGMQGSAMLAQADRSLYEAKAQGKDRVNGGRAEPHGRPGG